MRNIIYKLSFLVVFFLLLGNTNHVFAQSNNGKKFLLRDSLDYKKQPIGFNSKANDFNPIPYRGGLLFVSNKKTITNKIGANKVYWLPEASFGKDQHTDSARTKKWSFNDDNTAPTSNDNNILTRYTRKKEKSLMNAVEQNFSDFNPDAPFAFDTTHNSVIYPQISRRKIDGSNKWELWQADLVNGRLKNAHRILFIDSAADYLYPSLSDNGNRLYFASNKKSGQGGFDIYYVEKKEGQWSRNPVAVQNVNTAANETHPISTPELFTFSSDREGGVGGFDLYAINKGEKVSRNLGYPINSEKDDLGIAKIGAKNYLTSNRSGSIDVAALDYKPISIPVRGYLGFATDATIAPYQKLYIRDNDEAVIIDSVQTDANAAYTFNAKPNRNYSILSRNADGIMESMVLTTTDKILPEMSLALNLKGRSPKQVKDSLHQLWVIAEQKRQDSIAAISLEQKFIVRYGFDKAVLLAKEKLVLDSLLNKLVKMPSAYIVVGAFTDCIGSYKYNYQLSVKRAKYVVNYLVKNGLDKNRIVSNGYSKKYTLTPCLVKNNNRILQKDSRRAEIVLSDRKNTNWATLEKERGRNYYTVYNSNNKTNPISKNVVAAKPKVAVAKPNLAKISKPLPVKKDTSVAKVEMPAVKKTIVDAQHGPSAAKGFGKNRESSPTSETNSKPVDGLEAKVSTTIPAKESAKDLTPKLIVADASSWDAEMSKAEIVKALDSLAQLKREQERIVEYLTKRINKKPIDVFVSSDSVTIEIYDNAIHDKDSVSIIYNNRIIVDKHELKVNKPIQFKLKVDKNKKYNELVMVAENLGSEPPNTAVMFVTEKSGRRQQVMLSTDMKHNEVIYFIRIGKE